MADRGAVANLISAVVANIEAARAVEKPFFHLEFERVFPDDVYAEMVDHMPSAADYRPLPGRNQGNIREDGTLDPGEDRPVSRIHAPPAGQEARGLGPGRPRAVLGRGAGRLHAAARARPRAPVRRRPRRDRHVPDPGADPRHSGLPDHPAHRHAVEGHNGAILPSARQQQHPYRHDLPRPPAGRLDAQGHADEVRAQTRATPSRSATTPGTRPTRSAPRSRPATRSCSPISSTPGCCASCATAPSGSAIWCATRSSTSPGSDRFSALASRCAADCILPRRQGSGKRGGALNHSPRILSRIARLAAAGGVALLLAVRPAAAVTDIQLWHAMPGELGYQLDKLAQDFNASQRDFRIVPVFKGLYTETMLAALFALRLREHPAIVQVAEVATATMMAAQQRDRAGVRADARRARAVQSGRLSPGDRRLLRRHRRQPAVVPAQRLDADPLLQQGPVPLRRPQRQRAAEDLAGGRGGGREAARARAMRAASPPTIRRGSTSRISSPGTACRSPRARTAWTGSTPSS